MVSQETGNSALAWQRSYALHVDLCLASRRTRAIAISAVQMHVVLAGVLGGIEEEGLAS